MNQLCKVCGEPAAGFHFGAFTCEGCKSFFGRTYNNISAIAGCKNNGDCVINKKNRTACKACRLRKCLLVGMSKSGSRYGRRSNWFKIHCLLQEQQTQHQQQLSGNGNPNRGINSSNLEQLNHFHQQLQARQTYQDKTNPSIKTASMSPTLTTLQPPPTIHSVHNHHRLQAQNTFLSASNKFLNGSGGTAAGGGAAGCGSSGSISQTKSEPRLSSSPSDSGASSAGDVGDDSASIATSQGKQSQRQTSPIHAGGIAKLETSTHNADAYDAFDNRKRSFSATLCNSSEPLMLFSPAAIRSPFAAIVAANLPPPTGTPFATSLTVHRSNTMPASLNVSINVQDEPIDLSVKSSKNCCRTISPPVTLSSPLTSPLLDIAHKPAPLDLTLVRPQPMSG